ncbi:MAG: hypothetical protein LBT26_04485 [Clostridiales Family XIII bacterium]|jgi:hypothetical protein|nr:hypothetical protein [Clostridiales Family XIII bacterium]
MFEDLKAKGNKTAAQKSVLGLVSAALVFAIFQLNVFGFGAEAYVRWKPIVPWACAFVAVVCIINWIRAIGASGVKQIQKFCAKTPNPDAVMARLEQTWRNGLDFKAGRMDTEYLIITPDGFKVKVIPLKGIVWVYKDIVKSSNARYVYIRLEYKDEKARKHNFGLNDSAADRIMAYIMENCPGVAVGHDEERKRMFKAKDWHGLQENARIQRVAAGIVPERS